MVDMSSTVESVVSELLATDGLTPPVESRSDINDGYCSIVAAEVYERLGEPDDVKLCVGDNGSHYWLEWNGLFYDAERTEGVSEWRELPYWKRHECPSEFEYDLWVKHTGL